MAVAAIGGCSEPEPQRMTDRFAAGTVVVGVDVYDNDSHCMSRLVGDSSISSGIIEFFGLTTEFQVGHFDTGESIRVHNFEAGGDVDRIDSTWFATDARRVADRILDHVRYLDPYRVRDEDGQEVWSWPVEDVVLPGLLGDRLIPLCLHSWDDFSGLGAIEVVAEGGEVVAVHASSKAVVDGNPNWELVVSTDRGAEPGPAEWDEFARALTADAVDLHDEYRDLVELIYRGEAPPSYHDALPDADLDTR